MSRTHRNRKSCHITFSDGGGFVRVRNSRAVTYQDWYDSFGDPKPRRSIWWLLGYNDDPKRKPQVRRNRRIDRLTCRGIEHKYFPEWKVYCY